MSICGRSRSKAERILDGYGRGEEKLPVYKMPHLEGWAAAGDRLLIPAVGRHELIAVDPRSFKEVGRVATHGQPVFAVARPDGRHVWVNFAHPLNDTIDVVDTLTLQVVHRFKPGRRCCTWNSRRAATRSGCRCATPTASTIYDAATFAKKAETRGQEAVAASSSPRGRRGSGNDA